jgi:Protein of unknown function (DUF2794)
MTRQTSQLYRLADYKAKQKTVYFNRGDLNQLLAVYSRYVIRGEWRDYAIDHRDGFAVFSIYRHTQENPAFCIVKSSPGLNKHGDFQLYAGRRRLAAGRNLAEVLELFRRRPVLVGGKS